MNTSAQITIRIGHGSYSGTNAPAWPKTKSQAVEILRARGVKRDAARNAVKEALLGRHVTTRGGMFGNDTVEVAGIPSRLLA